jgi:AraC-like DNA-binding protein
VGGTPLAEAAGQAGFADQSHLTRWFTRYYGITPGGYRQAASQAA